MAESPFGHESSAINTGRILAAMGGLGIFVVMALGVIYLILQHDVMPNHARVVDEAGLSPPKPRLQAHPQTDIAAERLQKHDLLSGYGWADSSRSYARIPIQRAMQLYVDTHAVSKTARLAPATSTSGVRP